MTGAWTAVGAVVAVSDLWLLAICWGQRVILGGVLGATGFALALFAIASGPTGSEGEHALLVAIALLVIGVGLYGLGRALEQLLDEGPREES